MDNLITLKPFTDNDIDLFTKWLYTPHIALWYEEPLSWINEVKNRNTDFSFINHYTVNIDNKAIGFCQYYEYFKSKETWHKNIETEGTYSIDYLIGEDAYLRKGFGKAVIKELIKKIKTHKNAKRIIVQPDIKNTSSCNALLSAGFHYDKINELFIMEF